MPIGTEYINEILARHISNMWEREMEREGRNRGNPWDVYTEFVPPSPQISSRPGDIVHYRDQLRPRPTRREVRDDSMNEFMENIRAAQEAMENIKYNDTGKYSLSVSPTGSLKVVSKRTSRLRIREE